jgi:predicted transcriptional regulator
MQQDCLAESRDEIAAAIELGFAEAERGELIDGDEVRSRGHRDLGQVIMSICQVPRN